MISLPSQLGEYSVRLRLPVPASLSDRFFFGHNYPWHPLSDNVIQPFDGTR